MDMENLPTKLYRTNEIRKAMSIILIFIMAFVAPLNGIFFMGADSCVFAAEDSAGQSSGEGANSAEGKDPVLQALANSLAVDDTAQMVFSGVDIRTAADGSVQALIDVKLRCVESLGANFTLEYNGDLVQPSDASTNAPLTDDDANSRNFLQVDHSVFPVGSVLGVDGIPGPRPVIISDSAVKVTFAINPLADQLTALGSHLIKKEIVDQKGNVITDGNGEPKTGIFIQAQQAEGIRLGTLSFKVKDPAAFAKLSAAELANAFHIRSDAQGDNLFYISYIDTTAYPIEVFYNTDEHLDYQFQIKNSISSVTAVGSGAAVPASQVSADRGASYRDLIDYLNRHLRDVTITYASGLKLADTVTWGESDKNFKINGRDPMMLNYDPKGGADGITYTFTQKYNDEVDVTAKLTVTPVRVTGYTVEKGLDYITYTTAQAAQITAIPGSYPPGIDLPEKVRPVFDVTVPGKNHYQIRVIDGQNGWTQAAAETPITEAALNGVTGEYHFDGIPDASELPEWATNQDGLKAGVVRAIGVKSGSDGSDQESGTTAGPMDVSAQVQDDGTMVINVGSVGMKSADGAEGWKLSPIPEGTKFFLRLPSGETVDEAALTAAGGSYEVQLNQPADGKAIIRVKAPAVPTARSQQERLRNAINLASRGEGDFALAAQIGAADADAGRSDWASFNADPRVNEYTGGNNSDGTGYLFDYSNQEAAFFPFYANQIRPANTISLTNGNSVSTTYDGTNGAEPGRLTTITVESWELTDGRIAEGETVIFTGTLKTTGYAGYGTVKNQNNKMITLKLKVLPSTKTERIKDIADFTFHKKQVGYRSDQLQSQEFVIENNGLANIVGLSVDISETDGNRQDAFRLTAAPQWQLKQGETSSFVIQTKEGLPTGTYTAAVSVNSNRTNPLDTFQISFTVTENPVYQVILQADPEDAGTVSGGGFYEAGETFPIQATPFLGSSFNTWESIKGSGTCGNMQAAQTTYTMPDSVDGEIVLRAKFDVTAGFYLKLSQLEVRNSDSTVNPLRDSEYAPTAFDPEGFYDASPETIENPVEYYAAAPAGESRNTVRISLKYPQEAVQPKIEASISGSGVTVTPVAGMTDTYDLGPIELAALPADNPLKITLTADGGYVRTYLVHIKRKLSENQLAQFHYGNSPYGLIMRDDAVSQEDKELWKEKFDLGRSETGGEAYQFVDGFTPAGGVTGLIYHQRAWADTNYDRDENALFVYTGESFKDPGIGALTDSIGQAVSAAGINGKISLNLLSNPPLAVPSTDFRTVTSASYAAGTGLGGQVDLLKDLRVRPGLYSITYSFTDFDGSQVSVSRPLIVLAKPGDVNVNGTVDTTDAALLMGRYIDRLAFEGVPGYDTDALIYKYRICDANDDGVINGIDGRTVSSGKTVQLFYQTLQ